MNITKYMKNPSATGYTDALPFYNTQTATWHSAADVVTALIASSSTPKVIFVVHTF